MITKLDPHNIKIGDKVTIADNRDRYAGVIDDILDDENGIRIIVRQYLDANETRGWALKWDKREQEFFNKHHEPYLQVFRGSVEFHPTIEDILLDYTINYDPVKLPDGIIMEEYVDKARWRYGHEDDQKMPDDFITIISYPDGKRDVFYDDLTGTIRDLYDIDLDEHDDFIYHVGDEGTVYLTDEASERYMTQKARG